MIIACLGKGGSGKSSLATQLSLWLRQKKSCVLAIDADHNLDLSFNLTGSDLDLNFPYLGQAMPDLLNFFGLKTDQKYSAIFLEKINKHFYFGPEQQDPFSQRYSLKLQDNLWLMAAGPQTDQVLYGKSCSHVLSTPLKVYLPCLKLNSDTAVVVDEKAGADGVSTGIATGFDVALIVCDSSVHSLKTAKQIYELLNFYDTPSVFVANRIKNDQDRDIIKNFLPQEPAAYLPWIDNISLHPDQTSADWQKIFYNLWLVMEKIARPDRWERTYKKFKKNHDFWQ